MLNASCGGLSGCFFMRVLWVPAFDGTAMGVAPAMPWLRRLRQFCLWLATS